jgi:hypothetical protein
LAWEADVSGEISPWIAALLVTLTGVLLLVVYDWRVSIGLLAVQYLGVFLLVSAAWPLSMAVTRLIAGWMAGAVLGMAMLSLPQSGQEQADQEARPTRSAQLMGRYRLLPGEAPSPLFHLLAAGLVCLAIGAESPQLNAWLPVISLVQAWGGLILIGLGLLKLGFHTQPLHVALGLLTLYSGFEVLYAALNASPLIAALTAALTLGLALTGAYLMLAPHMEPGE